MYAVVNQLPLRRPVDQALLDSIEHELAPNAAAVPGFIGYRVVSVADDKAIMLVFYETLEVLQQGSKEAGTPWR